jgi:hypothetical protein
MLLPGRSRAAEPYPTTDQRGRISPELPGRQIVPFPARNHRFKLLPPCIISSASGTLSLGFSPFVPYRLINVY